MRASLFAVLAVTFLVLGRNAAAQDCPHRDAAGPDISSASRTLQGKVVFHNDMRQWLSLQLDSPVCGERVVELVASDSGKPHHVALEVFRGCSVKVVGSLGLPSTGYYSAELYQNVDKIEPLDGCSQQPQFPNYSKMKLRRSIRSYRVSMRFNYGLFDDPVHAKVVSGTQVLSPWQAYAHYDLTGGFAFYGYCADGFTMSRMTGTPAAKPWMVDNYLAMDPETAAEKHVHEIRVGFTCTRSR